MSRLHFVSVVLVALLGTTAVFGETVGGYSVAYEDTQGEWDFGDYDFNETIIYIDANDLYNWEYELAATVTIIIEGPGSGLAHARSFAEVRHSDVLWPDLRKTVFREWTKTTEFDDYDVDYKHDSDTDLMYAGESIYLYANAYAYTNCGTAGTTFWAQGASRAYCLVELN